MGMDPKELEALLAELENPPPEPPEPELVNGSQRAIDGTFASVSNIRWYEDGERSLSRDNLYILVDRAHAFLAAIAGGNTADSLVAIGYLRRQLDLIEYETIAIARSQRWSWKVLGEVLGVHPSSVHRRFVREQPVPRRRRTRKDA